MWVYACILPTSSVTATLNLELGNLVQPVVYGLSISWFMARLIRMEALIIRTNKVLVTEELKGSKRARIDPFAAVAADFYVNADLRSCAARKDAIRPPSVRGRSM